jgi:hypothetical protein
MQARELRVASGDPAKAKQHGPLEMLRQSQRNISQQLFSPVSPQKARVTDSPCGVMLAHGNEPRPQAFERSNANGRQELRSAGVSPADAPTI